MPSDLREGMRKNLKVLLGINSIVERELGVAVDMRLMGHYVSQVANMPQTTLVGALFSSGCTLFDHNLKTEAAFERAVHYLAAQFPDKTSDEIVDLLFNEVTDESGTVEASSLSGEQPGQ